MDENKDKDELTFEVTEEDITKGVPHDPEKCPLAWAVARQTGTREVAVGAEKIHVAPRTKYDHSPKTRRFVKDFDAGRAVRPGTFTVQVCK